MGLGCTHQYAISIHRRTHRGRKMSMQMLIVPDSYKNYQKWICDISVTEGVYGGTLTTPWSIKFEGKIWHNLYLSLILSGWDLMSFPIAWKNVSAGV